MNRKPVEVFQKNELTPFQVIFNLAAQMKDIINLGIGEPDLDIPGEVADSIAKAAREGYTHYPPVNGFADLRKEIRDYWNRRHGLNYAEDEVIVTAGCTQGLDMILRAYAGKGDEVLLTDPCFSTYAPSVVYTGAAPVMVPLKAENGFMISAADLERHITPRTKMLIINSPCNPTGAVYDRASLEAVAEVAQKYDLLVISDEIYECLIFDGEHTCFATLPGMRDRTFTVGGFSKTYAMTGLRLGYIMADRNFIPPLITLGVNTAMGVNSVCQKAAVTALQDCQYYVDNMVSLYKERAECAARLISAIPGLSCVPPKGTFYLMMDISVTGMKSLEFSQKLLKEAGVATIAGIAFGETADNFVRVSYNCRPEILNEAARRIESVVRNISSNK